MPNWCDNNLEVSGSKEDVKEFVSKSGKNNEEFLSTFVPMPKSVFRGSLGEEERKKYGDNNWYDWSVKHWGTKWNCAAHLITKKERHVIYQFDTAWSPPAAWLEAVSKLYPKLKFKLRFEEEGMDYRGILKAQNGELDEQDF